MKVIALFLLGLAAQAKVRILPRPQYIEPAGQRPVSTSHSLPCVRFVPLALEYLSLPVQRHVV